MTLSNKRKKPDSGLFIDTNKKLKVFKEDVKKRGAFVNFKYSIAEKFLYENRLFENEKADKDTHREYCAKITNLLCDKAESIESHLFEGSDYPTIVYFFRDGSSVFYEFGNFCCDNETFLVSYWGEHIKSRGLKNVENINETNRTIEFKKERGLLTKNKTVIIKKKNRKLKNETYTANSK